MGAEKSIPEIGSQKCRDVECLLTVIFRYRPLGSTLFLASLVKLSYISLAMLRANGIAPPPIQAASTSNKRPASTVDVIEILSDDSEDDIAKLEVGGQSQKGNTVCDVPLRQN